MIDKQKKDILKEDIQKKDAGKKVKKRKVGIKRILFRRVLPALFCSLILLFSVSYCSLMLYWEKNPVPDTVIKYVQKLFLRYDLKLETGKVNTVFPAGIRVNAFSLAPLEKYTFPEIASDDLILSFSFGKLFRGVTLPLHLQMNNGNLLFPLFPESGREGAEDVLILKSFFLDVEGEKGLVRIKKFCGSSHAGNFDLSGTVNNFLHVVASDLGDRFNALLWHERRLPPEGRFFSSRMKSIPEDLRMYLSLCAGYLRHPESSGKWITFSRKSGLPERPFLKANLHMDLHDFSKCSGNFLFSLPGFTLADRVSIEKCVLEYTLKNSVFALKKNKFQLASGGEFFLEGKYDENTRKASGKLSGKCPFEVIQHFLPREAVNKLSLFMGEKQMRKWKKEMLGFSAKLLSFSVQDAAYELILSLDLPRMEFPEFFTEKTSLLIRLTQEGFSGKGENICFYSSGGETEKISGKMSFSFRCDEKKFSAGFSGMVPFELLKTFSFFTENTKDFPVAGKNINIPFSGTLECAKENLSTGKDIKSELSLQIPEFTVCGIKVNSLAAFFAFSPEKITIRKLDMLLGHSLLLSLSGGILPGEKKMLLHLKSSGSPEKLFYGLSPGYRQKIRVLMEDLHWPQQGSLMDSTAFLFLDYSKKPCFYFADGNIVMGDFKYKNIPFRYGATRFMLDSSGILVLPGAVLETEHGKMVLRVCAKGRNNQGFFTNLFEDGILEFELKSDIHGNDVLRCLYPGWKSDFLDFPHKLDLSASGVIDYKNEAETVFTARINNGKCLWKKALLTDIDCTVQYAKELLSIPNASARTCNGTLNVDYHFDFRSNVEKGEIGIELKKADFNSLLKGMGAELKPLSGIVAETTGKLSAQVSFDEKDNLLLSGKGNAVITGEDMWHIPVLGELLKSLGRAWHTTALGTITRFDMDFSLDKTTFRINNGSSNGSVVAIRTDGEYNWLSEEYDFRILSELLKGTLPFAAMSKVLTPVSWILQKRIRGKGDDFILEE